MSDAAALPQKSDGLAVSGNSVYVCGSGGRGAHDDAGLVARFNATTGSRSWKRTSHAAAGDTGGFFGALAVVAGKSVYAAGSDGVRSTSQFDAWAVRVRP